RDHHAGAGNGAHDPLQPAALGRDQWSARARRELRAGAGRARGRLPADDAEGDGLRLLVAVLPGEGRAPRRADVRPGHRVRLPAAGRDVRELAPALGRVARLAAGGARRLLRGMARRIRQQRLRADRPDHARRAGGEERGPDRPVREGQAPGGPVGPARRAGVGPAALPAHLDDRLRLHSRRRATDAGQRSGRGRPERHGHGRVLGNADRHRARCLPHSRKLRVRGEPGQAAHADPATREQAGGARARTGRAARVTRRSLRSTALLLATLPWSALIAVALLVMAFLLATLLLAGCTVGPDYRRPKVAVPPDFRGQAPDTTREAESIGDIAWWKIFQDETLQSLIHTAIAANYDL